MSITKEQLKTFIEREADKAIFIGDEEVFISGANLTADLLLKAVEAIKTLKKIATNIDSFEVAKEALAEIETAVKGGVK